MKRTYYIIAMSFLGMFYSCSSFLDVVPDNVATIDNAFTDKYNAEKYLFTCYSYLPQFANRDENPALSGGDDIWVNENNAWRNGIQMAKGYQNITEPFFDFWRGKRGGRPLYVGIRDCNTFLEKIETVKDLNDYEKKQWIAEVNFLKAYYHYYLIRMYGPISIMDQNVLVSAETTAIKVSREPVDSCFAYVVRLLDKAAVDLPDVLANPFTNLGRITKPIALAVKAEVLITAASPIFNGNQIHSTLKNKDGKALFSLVYDVKKWEKAAQACKEAILKADSLKLGLFQTTDFLNGVPMNDTTKQIAALRGIVSERWNKEIIWGATNNDTWDLQSSSSPRWYTYLGNPVNSNHAPTLKIAEEFYSKNGVPINEDKTWNYDNRFKLRIATNKDWIFVEPGQQTVELNFDRELRYYADISFDRGAWFGNGSPATPEKPWYIRNRRGDFSSIFEVSLYSVTGMYPKKLVNIADEVRDGNNFYSQVYSFPVIRLADLYLYYAEALNEMKGTPDAQVYEYIDKVRTRAGLKGVVESWNLYSNVPEKPTTKNGMRDIIQRERLIELSFEGHRFWDLRRWLLAKKYMNSSVQGWNVQKGDILEYYRVTTLYSQTFTEREYFWPIPEDEIVKNPNLVQNIGW